MAGALTPVGVETPLWSGRFSTRRVRRFVAGKCTRCGASLIMFFEEMSAELLEVRL